MKSPQATVNYAKLKSGEWGLRGPISVLEPAVVKNGHPANEVEVTLKNGGQKHEFVGSIVTKFDDGNCLASIYKMADECIECGEPLRTDAQKRSGYCRPDCG